MEFEENRLPKDPDALALLAEAGLVNARTIHLEARRVLEKRSNAPERTSGRGSFADFIRPGSFMTSEPPKIETLAEEALPVGALKKYEGLIRQSGAADKGELILQLHDLATHQAELYISSRIAGVPDALDFKDKTRLKEEIHSLFTSILGEDGPSQNEALLQREIVAGCNQVLFSRFGKDYVPRTFP